MSDDLSQGQPIQQNQDDVLVTVQVPTPSDAPTVQSQAVEQPISMPYKEQAPPLMQAPVETAAKTLVESSPVAAEVTPPSEQQEAVPENIPEQEEAVSATENTPQVAPPGQTASYLPPAAVQLPSQPLPMSYTEAVAQEKQTKLEDSSHWLAKLMQFLWKRADPAVDKQK
jgi:hypothetical protein